ncbi:hypothetical protein ACWATR_38305 [Nostoc sp. UIC 10890]
MSIQVDLSKFPPKYREAYEKLASEKKQSKNNNLQVDLDSFKSASFQKLNNQKEQTQADQQQVTSRVKVNNSTKELKELFLRKDIPATQENIKEYSTLMRQGLSEEEQGKVLQKLTSEGLNKKPSELIDELLQNKAKNYPALINLLGSSSDDDSSGLDDED